jgi:hypothetical protein
MLLDTTRQSDLLADLSTCGRRQLDLGEVSFDTKHAPSRRRGADVDQQQLVFDEF